MEILPLESRSRARNTCPRVPWLLHDEKCESHGNDIVATMTMAAEAAAAAAIVLVGMATVVVGVGLAVVNRNMCGVKPQSWRSQQWYLVLLLLLLLLLLF